jgi:hypothetical protein
MTQNDFYFLTDYIKFAACLYKSKWNKKHYI